jgi:hypothetical protein
MGGTLQIDRVSALLAYEKATRTNAVVTKAIQIPGGYSQFFPYGIDPTPWSIQGWIGTDEVTNPITVIEQLRELGDNPNQPFVYIGFPPPEQHNSGWFVIDRVDSPRDAWQRGTFFPFTLSARRIGGVSDLRLSTFYSHSIETYTGWTTSGFSNVPHPIVALPYNISTPTYPLTNDTIQTSEVILNLIAGISPASGSVAYRSSTLPADWFWGECKVFDTVTAGNASEGTWVQVFSPKHSFAGDTVLQSGTLRYIYSPSTQLGTFYANDQVVGAATYFPSGQLKFKNYSATDIGIVGFSITYLSSEEIHWSEVRTGNGSYAILVQVNGVLRRGMPFARLQITPTAVLDQATSLRLVAPGNAAYFPNYFNDTYNGVYSSNLLSSSTHNYGVGYSTSRNLLTGFFLLDKPIYQPPAGAGNYEIGSGATWTANQTKIAFVFSFGFNTGSFSLTNARSLCRSWAARSGYYLTSELDLCGQGQW